MKTVGSYFANTVMNCKVKKKKKQKGGWGGGGGGADRV